MFNSYPYTNFHELNLAYFIQQFQQIFQQWHELYTTMESWKDSTTEDLEAWKDTQEALMAEWESGVLADLNTWKDSTEEDISEWEQDTLNDLNQWRQAFDDLFDSIQEDARQASLDAESARQSAALAQAFVGSPLVASTASEMIDQNKVYVYVGSETGYTSGNWYYYDGTSWVSGGVYNAVAVQTDPTLTQQGVAADAAAVGDIFDVILNETESAIVTSGLNTTNSGLTVKKNTDSQIIVYGEATATRHYGFLNGQSWVKVSSHDFDKTLDAGTYIIESNASGAQETYVIRATYSTFANSFVLASQNAKNTVITFTGPVMVSFNGVSGREYGTELNPTYIDFSAKKIEVNDATARGDAQKALNQLNNDDVSITTYLAKANSNYANGPDRMLIKLKRSAFQIGVKNNDPANTNSNQKAYRATRSAYYWIQYHPEMLFVENCNFSGGLTTDEVDAHHYALRYAGQEYAEVDPPRQRAFFAFNSTDQTFAYYAAGSTLSDIPSSYDYAFAVGDLLVENGEVTSFVDTNPVKEQRNVFGWDDDYIYIFFCEGRNNVNAGYTLTEVANVMQAYGAEYAVNFDGGGSVCVCANIPNPSKINAYSGDPSIRPTTLNMNYKYIGTQEGISETAKDAILDYMANVYKPITADLRRLLGEIGGGTVSYVYDSDTSTYRLTISS